MSTKNYLGMHLTPPHTITCACILSENTTVKFRQPICHQDNKGKFAPKQHSQYVVGGGVRCIPKKKYDSRNIIDWRNRHPTFVSCIFSMLFLLSVEFIFDRKIAFCVDLETENVIARSNILNDNTVDYVGRMKLYVRMNDLELAENLLKQLENSFESNEIKVECAALIIPSYLKINSIKEALSLYGSLKHLDANAITNMHIARACLSIVSYLVYIDMDLAIDIFENLSCNSYESILLKSEIALIIFFRLIDENNFDKAFAIMQYTWTISESEIVQLALVYMANELSSQYVTFFPQKAIEIYRFGLAQQDKGQFDNELARGAYRLIVDFCEKGLSKYACEMYDLFGVIKNNYVLKAEACFAISSMLIKKKDFQDAYEFYEKIKYFPDDENIRLRKAKALFNFINYNIREKNNSNIISLFGELQNIEGDENITESSTG